MQQKLQLMFPALALFGLASATPTELLQQPTELLQQLISRQSVLFNVSISAGATLGDGTTFAAAAGLDDHMTGSKVSTSSLYPSGSVTKLFTSTAAMRLVEQGVFTLDTPFHTIVDPWLKAQGKQTMKDIWGGDATIESVTVSELLQMRGGLGDYDDFATKAWQIAHPTTDITPDIYVANVTKRFLFPPGQGGSYTGIGYVLLGWVLCAASDGCHTWSDLDQMALVTTPSYDPKGLTTFMKMGVCSQYKGVVHQYAYFPQEKAFELDLAASEGGDAPAATMRQIAELTPMRITTASSSPTAALPKHCTDPSLRPGGQPLWYKNTQITGASIGEKNVSSGGAEACCGLADTTPGAYLWSFIPSSGPGGTCRFFEGRGVKGSHKPGVTSGRVDPPLRESDFVDLYDDSCLNGWTMGNIATTPSEVTKFYHALFTEKIVSAESIKQMTTWKPLTTGFARGAPYGFALFLQQVKLPLDGVKRCNGLPYCKCSLFRGCEFQVDAVGHPGLDWGSGMPNVGLLVDLNISYAMASNTGENTMGMNTSIGVMENYGVLNDIYCDFFDILVHAQVPSYPKFKCH